MRKSRYSYSPYGKMRDKKRRKESNYADKNIRP